MSDASWDSGAGPILLTGASGFVGRHLAAYLRRIAPGRRLVCADRTPPASIGPGVEHVALDLTDSVSIDRVIAEHRPSLIFHLAGMASVAGAAAAGQQTWRVNAGGALELALAVNQHVPTATIVFASSAEVYGDAFLTGLVSEQSAPQPRSIYARSKLCAEQLLAEALAESAQLIVVRPTNHIGPGQDDRFAVPSFAGQIAAAELRGETTTIRVGNLAARRDFMDVRDVVIAYGLILQTADRLSRRETFNIASGTSRSLAAMLDGLRSLATVPTAVEIDEQRFRAAEVPSADVDASRFRDVFGWQPDRPIEATLADVLDEQRLRARSGLRSSVGTA